MKQTPTDLYQISEPEAPEAPAVSNVVHISGIRCHEGAVDPVAAPWPRESSWRDLMERLARKRATKDPAR